MWYNGGRKERSALGTAMITQSGKEQKHTVLQEKRLGKSTLGRLLLAHVEKPLTSGLRVAPAIGAKGTK